jgi:hypothetical protein
MPQNGVKAQLTEDPQLPGWATVPSEAVVQQLTQQLAGMIQQLAMRDAYIAQLHQVLEEVAGTVPRENPAPAP